jgi:cyanophycinase
MHTALRGSILTVAAGFFLVGCGAPQTNPGLPQPAAADIQGHLLIVGGGPRPAVIMDRFIELAGGAGEARIAVIPMASGNSQGAGEQLVAQMRELGAADAFSLNVTRDEALQEATAARLEGATGVWFSGGVQSRHTDALKDTPVEAKLHELLRDGAVLGGTSAGAAIMSDLMITGGELRRGGDRPADEAWITIDRDNVVTDPGFGFLPGAIVDQHFVRRKRHNRLLSLVFENPDQIGVGIDEATALQVNPDGRWEVVGASVVVIYDARESSITANGADALGAAGVRLHVLPGGSIFDPRRGEARLAPGRPSANRAPVRSGSGRPAGLVEVIY